MVCTKFYNFGRLWEITPEPSRLELSFLHATLLPNTLYNLTKFHENSSKGITNDTIVIFLITFLYVFLVTCYIFLPLAPPRGITLGHWYHALKGLALGKYHTKFQLSSPKGMKIISCKRNADVKLHLNLQVNLNLVTNVTYAHTYGRNITAKRYMPHYCLRQVGA